MHEYITDIFKLYQKATDGLTFEIRNTIPDLITKLSRSKSKKAANMIEILAAGKEAGLPDDFVISMMLIAGPESNWVPTAYNPSYGASGYFQLLPKYFSTAALSTTRKIIIAQLKQIYAKRTKGDLAVMYGHHFYQMLGIAYAKAPTMGLQLKVGTYGQYVIVDSKGTSFHSPYLLALYCIAKFEAVAGISLDISIPTIAEVLQVKTSKTPSFYPITFGEGGSMFKVSTSSNFSIQRGLDAISDVVTGSIAESLTSVLTLGPVSSLFGEPLFEGDTGDDASFKIQITDRSGASSLASVSFGDAPNKEYLDILTTRYSQEDIYPILYASYQSYVRAIDQGLVDVNTLRIIVTQILDPRVPISTRDELVLKSKSAISYLLADVSKLMQVIVGSGGEQAFQNMTAVLLTNASKISHTTHYAQLQYHNTCAITMRGVMFPALAYSSVLWPFSILCTPAFGSGPTVFKSDVPFICSQKLLELLDTVPDPGVNDIIPAAKGLIEYDKNDVRKVRNRIVKGSK